MNMYDHHANVLLDKIFRPHRIARTRTLPLVRGMDCSRALLL